MLAAEYHQRWFVENTIDELKVHLCATAYIPDIEDEDDNTITIIASEMIKDAFRK